MSRKRNTEEILYQQIYDGERKRLYIASDGKVYTQTKSSRKLRALKGYVMRDTVYVRIQNKQYSVKHLVAQTFMPRQYHDGDFVECIDGNMRNCAINNLRIIPRQQYFAHLQNRRMCKTVQVTYKDTGKVETYSSIKDASLALGYDSSYLAKALRGGIAMPEKLRRTCEIAIVQQDEATDA